MSSTNNNAMIDVNAIASNSSTIYSSSDDDNDNLRRITRNCIVEQKMKDVYNEWTAKRNNVKWIYGIVEYLEDEDEASGERAWHVMWHIGPYNIGEFNGFGPHLAVHEYDLILVKSSDDDIMELDIPYLNMYTCQNTDGCWAWK